MDSIVAALKLGRSRSMQSRKAAIMKEFMIARRWVEECYEAFGPGDLPVDVHRILRDLAITRDQMIDAACAEIDKEYRIAVAVLTMVAENDPGAYSRAAKQFKRTKSWKRHPPAVSAPKIAKVLPVKVLEGLSATLISGVVEQLLSTDEGLTFNQLAKAMSLDGDDKLPQRNAVKNFCAYLRDNKHVRTTGTGRGQRMMAAESLQTLRAALVNESEA
jgi:hypothetical protein